MPFMTLTQLLQNNGEKLNQIIDSQREYINAHAAEDILQFILEVENPFPWKLQEVFYN